MADEQNQPADQAPEAVEIPSTNEAVPATSPEVASEDAPKGKPKVTKGTKGAKASKAPEADTAETHKLGRKVKAFGATFYITE